MAQSPPTEHPLLRLARVAIAGHLSGERPTPSVCVTGEPAGVFVTLRTADGSLRGCVGSVQPTQPDLAAEVARSAVLAATRDPRFEPVTACELSGLSIEVSVLGMPESVAGLDGLDPAVFGVIVRGGNGRQGLLLPGIVGIEDAWTQVALARRKAGIPTQEPVALRRFRVQKFYEAPPST